MFFLEIYKIQRLRTLWLLGLPIIIAIIIVFTITSEDEAKFIYHPLLDHDNILMIYFFKSYNFFFIFFIPFFLIILFALLIYPDKAAGLLRAFTVMKISKIKYWITKYVFLQLLTMTLILIYLFLPVTLYALINDASVFGVHFFQTGIFLSLRSWLALMAFTTLIFLFQMIIPSLTFGILASLALYVWLLILPNSPLLPFVNSVLGFEDLSLDRLPYLWNLHHVKREVLSLRNAFIFILIFMIAVYFLRQNERIRQLLFLCILFILASISCTQNGNDTNPDNTVSSVAKDSLLLHWLDTVHIQTSNGQVVLFNDLLDSTPAKTIFLDIWDSHCIPCMKAFPRLEMLSTKYPPEEFKIIYLNTDEEPGRWHRALTFTENSDHPDHYRFLLSDPKLLTRVGLNIYPRYLILDSNHNVIEYHASAPNQALVDSLILNIR